MSRKLLVFAATAVLCLAAIILRPSHPGAATLESSPISLTNPDGQALQLIKYDLRAAVHGSLSLVEMEMTFRNPENRQMEGRFTYTLPPGATISRFAKEVNGKLMEGEIVEKLRAQAIFTEILHTMRDPALLEADQGNRFSARVFPVPANGTVRLLLAFSKLLPMKDGARKLTIPLAGLPKIAEFNFTCTGRPLESETGNGVVLDKEEALGEDLSALSRRSLDFTPTKDIELSFKAAADKPIRTLKAGNFQMVQFLYNVQAAQATAPESDWVFYFDTSASGADTEAPRLQVIDVLLNRLTPTLAGKTNQKISAYAFDLAVADILHETSITGDFRPNVTHALRARHALGATNLEAALKHIGAQARASQNGRTFVLVSDGIATWGARETKDLLAALGDWPAKDTLHALVIGNKQDQKTLSAIVEKTRGRIVTFPLSIDLEANASKAIAELRAPLGAHFEAYDEGTAWIYPKSFHDVRSGQELIAFSEIKEGGKSMPGFIQRGGDGKTIKDTQANVAPVELTDFAPLLQREAYKVYLDHLEKEEQAQSDAMKRAEMRKKRLELSIKNRVLCPLTSLLVLETEQDYRRFGITRDALTAIMEIGKSGIELRKRAGEDAPLAPAALPPPVKAAPPNTEVTKTPARNTEQEIAQLRAEVEKLRLSVNAQRAAVTTTAGTSVDAIMDSKYGPDATSRYELFATGGGPGTQGLDPNVLFGDLGDLQPAGSGTGYYFSGGAANLGRNVVMTNGILPTTDFPRPSPERAGLNTLPEPIPPAVFRDEEYQVQINADKPNEPPRFETRTRKVQVTPQSQTAPAETPRGIYAPATPPPATGNPTFGRRVLGATPQPPAAIPNIAVPWIADAAAIPADEQIAKYRIGVEALPRNRHLRNTYADALLKAGKWDNLQAEVFQWLPFDPENPAVYEFLGKSATGLNDPALALRAYSSIAEIAPNRAALLTRAGFLLLGAKNYDAAQAMFREALKNRQDDPNIHRSLALSLSLSGQYDAAAGAYEAALMREFHQRYGDVKRVLREEYAYVLRAWRKKEPAKSDAILARAEKAGVDLLSADALRVTLCWETDANDVDLHIVDPNGEECYYKHNKNASGLELYSDQTQGLGPEVIRTTKALAGTYHIGVNYFNAGPMGVSRGIVVVMKPVDGIDENPQIIPFALIEGGNKVMRHIGTVGY